MSYAHLATLRAFPRCVGVAFIAASWLGCYGAGGSAPSSTPAKNPLDDAPPAAATEAPPQAPEDVASKKNKFDEEQAKIVLGRASASARTCVDVVDKDQPHGEANVTVTFTGAGRSTAATVNAPFDGTPIGQCVTRAFVNVIVPPFDGADVDVPVTVILKPSDKAAEKKDPAAKSKKK